MDDTQTAFDQTFTLDGNAAAGILEDVFAKEMTASITVCASCGQQGEIGELLAFTQGPGVVLRCPACKSIILRIVKTPRAIYIDFRGAGYLRLTE